MSIYAVNGKVPIIAWIPSLDSAGNGTNTVTNLIGGGLDGTLVNMDAATDWVNDTGASGVRALDFDGVNDVIRLGIARSFPFSISAWIKPSSLHNAYVVGVASSISDQPQFHLAISVTGKIQLTAEDDVGQVAITSITSYTTDTWIHVLGVWASATSRSLFVNGAADGTGTASVPYSSAIDRFSFGRFDRMSPALPFAGRGDDIRFFEQSLNVSDASYLYSSGRVATPYRRNNPLISGGF